jgi:ABC-type uncharacterized transport system substrate-binding protein
VITFYDPRRATAIESSKLGREAARKMGIQLIERHVTSDEELQNNVRTLKGGEADAYLAVSDPIASNPSQVIIEAAIRRDYRPCLISSFMLPKEASAATP